MASRALADLYRGVFGEPQEFTTSNSAFSTPVELSAGWYRIQADQPTILRTGKTAAEALAEHDAGPSGTFAIADIDDGRDDWLHVPAAGTTLTAMSIGDAGRVRITARQ